MILTTRIHDDETATVTLIREVLAMAKLISVLQAAIGDMLLSKSKEKTKPRASSFVTFVQVPMMILRSLFNCTTFRQETRMHC